MEPFVESTELIDRPDALRERARRDGYLYFRELLDPEEVRRVRAAICRVLDRHGWLDPGTNPVDAITTREPRIEGQAAFSDVYDEIQRLESFHAFAHAPQIYRVLDTVFQEPTLLHPRNIARVIFPNAVQHSTPPHQDYVHIQGTPDTWTAWIPLGDCPMELGSLAMLSGSHTLGLLPVKSMLGAGGVGIPDDLLRGVWHAGDMVCGDVLLFHSHTVHRGLPNLTSDRMRLSVDFRYQGRSQPIKDDSLLPHHNRLTWDEIYRDWESDRFKYYWKNLDLKVVPHDPNIYKFIEGGKEKVGY